VDADSPTVIAHISDLHCGSIYFQPSLANRVVNELNELRPDVVVLTGDLTDMGFHQEFRKARNLVNQIECENILVLPGNHDSRNVGEVHFAEYFGARNSDLVHDRVRLLGLDSTEPDLDSGRIGRGMYRWIEDRCGDPDEFKVVCLHHHLVPVPGAGRERNTVYDAGDFLRVIASCGVDVVLCGHKHVPNVWRVEDILVVNAGTACSLRLRGAIKPSYNVVELFPGRVRVTRHQPFGTSDIVADFRRAHRRTCRWRPVDENDDGTPAAQHAAEAEPGDLAPSDQEGSC
jgi:3',5'-cyclic AMP phosphodiesterase CpdA